MKKSMTVLAAILAIASGTGAFAQIVRVGPGAALGSETSGAVAGAQAGTARGGVVSQARNGTSFIKAAPAAAAAAAPASASQAAAPAAAASVVAPSAPTALTASAIGTKNGVGPVVSGKVAAPSTEADVQNGRAQFDLAREHGDLVAAPVMAHDSEFAPSNLEPASKKGTTMQKIGTAADLYMIRALAHAGSHGYFAGHPVKATLAGLVGIASVRSSPRIMEVLNDKSIDSGAVRYGRIFSIAFVEAPIELAKDSYNQLVVPAYEIAKQIVTKAVEVMKDVYNAAVEIAKAVKEFVVKLATDAIKALRNVYDAAVLVAKDLYNAAVEAAEFVRDHLVQIADRALRLSRGAAAGTLAGILAVGVSTLPMIKSFVKKAIGVLITEIVRMPASFRIASTAVILGSAYEAGKHFGVIGAAKAAATAVAIAATTSFIGGWLAGATEGYRNGFWSGVKKGYGDAVKTENAVTQ